MIESVAIRLGVSPTPVREALARLAGEQLVAFRAYVGYSALPPLSLAELRDLFEAREVIECAGAVRACERSTDADLARLREIDARIRAGHYGKDRYSEFVSFVNDNQRFHETLLDAARNPELRRAFDALNYEARIARRTRGRGSPRPRPDLRGARRDHRRAGARATRTRSSPRSPSHARESHRRLADDLARRRSVLAGSATPSRRATRRSRPRARAGLAREREAAVELERLAVQRRGRVAASQCTSAASSSSVVSVPARRVLAEGALALGVEAAGERPDAIALAQNPLAAFSITATRSTVCSRTPPAP